MLTYRLEGPPRLKSYYICVCIVHLFPASDWNSMLIELRATHEFLRLGRASQSQWRHRNDLARTKHVRPHWHMLCSPLTN